MTQISRDDYKLPVPLDSGAAKLQFLREGIKLADDEYSLSNVLERFYINQLALEAAIMELTLWIEQQRPTVVGENVRGALDVIGENAGFIKQGIAKIRSIEN